MVHYIENDYLKVGVKEFGCELTSIKSKATDFEYLWQGDEKIWSGQSPILFPIVGRLIEDKYYLNGVAYEMPKHGFARKLQWNFLQSDSTSMKFVLSDSEETFKLYPYHFDLVVTYTLDGKVLKVSHDIINKNDGTMLFSLGAHPAFNCKIGDYLEFDNNQTCVLNEQIDEESYLMDNQVELLKNEKRITIEKNTFDHDALILSGYTDKVISLKSDDHNRVVRFYFDSPVLGIWAKPNAPYVCIEPWWGINDNHVKKADLSEKRGIMSLNAEESRSFSWRAEITE